MTDKKQTRKTEVELAPVSLEVIKAKSISDEVFHARLLTNGDFSSSAIVSSYLQTTTTDPGTILETLKRQAQAIHQGDMRQVESMLMGQAVALQSMFTDFALRAKNAKSLQVMQCLAQLALRSQAGSRSTLQTLADVKNPRQVAFVKQTNVAQTQQINNGMMPPSREETIQVSPNELLVKVNHGSKKMDRRAEKTPSRVDKDLVAVDAIHRPPKSQGKTRGVA